MRRSQEAEHLDFDPEPERTLHARRRLQRQAMADGAGDNMNNQASGNGDGRLFQQGFANQNGNQQIRRTLRDLSCLLQLVSTEVSFHLPSPAISSKLTMEPSYWSQIQYNFMDTLARTRMNT